MVGALRYGPAQSTSRKVAQGGALGCGGLGQLITERGVGAELYLDAEEARRTHTHTLLIQLHSK
jgi:hypothetical protein